MNLFWVDNDYITILNPLSKRLERKGFSLKKFATYEEGLNFVNGPEFDEVKCVLLDVIIPANTKCLSYAGFEIANAIAQVNSVKRIAFLSVVLRNEINEYYNALREAVGDRIELKYFDKAMLLEPNIFDELVGFLKGPGEKRS